MVLNPNSKVKELMKNPDAVELLMKYMTQFNPKSPQIKMALPMTVKQLLSAPQSGVKLDDREAFFKALEEAQFE